jgi:hypothetical protein
MQTTEGGLFAAPSVTPAPGYKIEVEKPGFAKWQSEDFEVLVGQTVDFKVNLQVGSSSTKVEVTAEAPLVESTKSGVTAAVTQLQIDNLPINGRRVDSYVLMTPAVVKDGEFGLLSFRGIAMGNSFLTDGNDTTNSFYNENAGRTRIGSQISQDAVQEFQVLSNGFSAEFGRAMGGVVNTVTRSGTNGIHGTGYGFYRSSTLEALDRYSNGIRTPEHRDTAGFSVGGPIKQDKLFYFVNYDYTGRNFPGINRIVNNSLTDGAGHQFYPEADECHGSAHIQPASWFRQNRLAAQRSQYCQLRPERNALGLAPRHPDADCVDRRRPTREQWQLHCGRSLRQGILDIHSHR